MLSAWNAKMHTSVANNLGIVTGANRSSNVFSNQFFPWVRMKQLRGRTVPVAAGLQYDPVTDGADTTEEGAETQSQTKQNPRIPQVRGSMIVFLARNSNNAST